MSIEAVSRPLAGIVLLTFFAACSSARAPVAVGGPSESGRATQTSEEAAEGIRDARMAAALDQAVQGRWKDLRLLCECRTKDSWAAAEIFADGTAVWNNGTQFQLDRAAIVEVLRDIQRLGFAEMPDTFGGRKAPEEFALRVTCHLALEIDGASKEVVQLEKGDQSRELRLIAESVFDACREPAAAGLSPESLGDALEQMAGGRLSDLTLELILNRKPDEQALRAGESGYLLRIDAGTATVRPHLAAGLGEEKVLAMPPGEIRQLARLLAQNDTPALPVNLYAETYTDFSLQVLKWRKSIQARQFANMTPKTHGANQARFDAIRQRLEEIAEEVLSRGVPAPKDSSQ